MLPAHCLKLGGEYQGHDYSDLHAAVNAAMQLTRGGFDLQAGIGMTEDGREVRIYGHLEEALSNIERISAATEGGRVYETFACPCDVSPFRIRVGSPGSLSLSNLGMID